METRRRRGWRLTTASWRLARRDPTLVPLALLALGCFVIALVAAISLTGDFGGREEGAAARQLLAALGGSFLSTLVLVFFCVALAHAASGGFEGQPLTLREALGEARESLGPAALWTLIAVAVTIGFQLVGATGDGGKVVNLVGGFLWCFLVTYVVPVIALAGAGAGEAIGESASLARRRWGEQLTGGIAIFVVTMVSVAVWALLCGVGVHAVDDDQKALGGALLVVGVLGVAFTLVLSFATTQAFVVALYRLDAGELSPPELESPPPATPIGGRPGLRIAGILAGLMVMATLVGALLPHDRQPARAEYGTYTEENGYFYTYFSEDKLLPLGPGSPVVYREREVGEVVATRGEDGRYVVWFRAPPQLAESIHLEGVGIRRWQGFHTLQIGTPEAPGRGALS
jgi:Family of unknown function (DUF6159)